MKRIIAATLAVCLSVGLLAGTVLGASREKALEWSMLLADNVRMTTTTQAEEGSNGTDLLQEHVLTYTYDRTFNRKVWPIVIYGSTLYGRSTMSQIAKYLDDEDLSLVAGVNGAFFDMSTGIPYGLVVTDGVLRTSGNVNSVGFGDGDLAVIGVPELHVRISGGAFNGAEIFYNKALTTSNGIGLYSRDYDEKTKSSVSAYNVVLQPEDGAAELTMRGSVKLTVSKIVESTASCAIPNGGFVLAIAENTSYTNALSNLKALRVGDSVTVTTECAPDWEKVVYACGGGDMLVENSLACDSFTLDTRNEQRARTAVGIKEDGSLVFYTADESANSTGMDLYDLAQTMEDLGCETALNLDGGGSTMLGVQYPGYDKCATANTPTDGTMRACANFIFLVRKKTVADEASSLFLYPMQTYALPGVKIGFTLCAADPNYMAADVPQTLRWSSTYGTVGEGYLDLSGEDIDASIPQISVSASSGNMTARATVNILSEVTSIRLYKEDGKTAVKTLHAPAESDVQLTAGATYYGQSVVSVPESFTWKTTGGIGTISGSGKFTAASVSKNTEGTIEVSYGETTASIPVTVSPTNPFSDTKGHWAENYINDLYFEGTLTGSTGKDGKLLYRPDDSMTRQEFVVALMRYLGTKVTDYSSVKLPFVDADEIGAWALDAMKAAYSLGYMGGSNELGKLYGHPTATITRQEAMVILSRTMPSGGAAADLDSQFSDSADIAKWAREPLARMVQAGIISGSKGKLNPTGKVTRAEVAKMLWALENQ